MYPLRCCVIAIDQPTATTVAEYISRTPSLCLAGCYPSAQQAFTAISAAEVDVVYAQLSMPQLSGLELARLLPAQCRLVLLADTPDRALDAFDAGAADYLMLPVSYDRFLIGANRLTQSAKHTISDSHAAAFQSIMVKTDYKLMQIPLGDILFIEGLKDYVKFYLAQDQKSVMSLMSMRQLEQYLPQEMFMRVHRSYIINLRHLRIIDRGRIVFGAHFIPVSESFKPQLNLYIAQHSIAPNTSEN